MVRTSTPEVNKTRFKLDSKERHFLLPSETFLTYQVVVYITKEIGIYPGGREDCKKRTPFSLQITTCLRPPEKVTIAHFFWSVALSQFATVDISKRLKITFILWMMGWEKSSDLGRTKWKIRLFSSGHCVHCLVRYSK